MIKKKKESSIADILPDKPLESKVDPTNLVIWMITEPKWGKTAFFMNNPDCLLLGFEEGHKLQRGYKMTIDKWDQAKGEYPMREDADGVMHCTAMQALKALKATRRFNYVAIDTVDMAALMCSDYHCEKGGVSHISELGDYGKGFDVGLNTPMRRFLMEILKTGRGVGLISHSKVEVAKFTSGEKARKESRLGKGVRYLCESQADIIMHGEFGLKHPDKKKRDRILVCEGDADVLAGNRSGAVLPERYIVTEGKQWQQFCKFFSDPSAAEKAEAIFRKRSRHARK